MPEQVRAFAPATIGNVDVGFDVLGLALEGIGDVVVATLDVGSGVRIGEVHGAELPRAPDANTAGIAAIEVCRRAGIDAGIRLDVHKGLPVGTGMGSSAASAAAAAFATNRLLGAPLDESSLVACCVEAEAAVSGRHADNVAPALLGGLVLVRGVEPVRLVQLPVPTGLRTVVVRPDLVVPTREARAALPDRVPMADLIASTRNIASFVAGCFQGDLALLGDAMQDPVVTPVRVGLIPGAAEALGAARSAGALGASVSGAGPSLFALCDSVEVAERVGDGMVAAFAAVGCAASVLHSRGDAPGAREVVGV